MTLADDMESDIGDVFLDLDEMAESITHWPEGLEAAATAVTAIVDIKDRKKDYNGDRAQVTSGRLLLDDSVTTHDDDRWIIDGVAYQTETRKPARRGCQVVMIKRRTRDLGSTDGRGRLR